MDDPVSIYPWGLLDTSSITESDKGVEEMGHGDGGDGWLRQAWAANQEKIDTIAKNVEKIGSSVESIDRRVLVLETKSQSKDGTQARNIRLEQLDNKLEKLFNAIDQSNSSTSIKQLKDMDWKTYARAMAIIIGAIAAAIAAVLQYVK